MTANRSVWNAYSAGVFCPLVLARACLFLLLFITFPFIQSARAQDTGEGVIGYGDAVVTGFSGTLAPPAGSLPPGVSELDETFIDPGGASLKVFDISHPGGQPAGQLIDAPVKFEVPASRIGQVFGLALDNADPPNIYATATSVHGLQIVLPDADGDGRPERLKLGHPGAQWMAGQFGEENDGGPGSVWKIDGETGEVELFADIESGGEENSGAGLGNIAFDAVHEQFFVSDLDTGLIHRLDMDGDELDTFDHGATARPANGLEAVADDPEGRLDIESPEFDAEYPESWGFTDPRRQVWGLAVYGNRLYYAVSGGPQIWSVGLTEDGGFGNDARAEIAIDPDPRDYPVSDIAFTSSGEMILAQRGGIVSRYDYSRYQTPRNNRVLRFRLESPDNPDTPGLWSPEPDEYAIGFPATYRNTAGGISIGYGYRQDSDGSYTLGSCEGTLWTSGDALRDNPLHTARLSAGGPATVHGIQGNALDLVRPKNEPPWMSYFVDYDGAFDDPEASGHVGDVEIPRNCAKLKSRKADLRIIKRALDERCDIHGDCTFALIIENVGSEAYSGPLELRDTSQGRARLVDHSPSDWECGQVFEDLPGTYSCSHEDVELAPGDSLTLELTFTLPGWWDRYVYRNCAELVTPGIREDGRRYNNRSCDYVPTGEPGGRWWGPDIQVEKYDIEPTCDVFGNCPFVVVITNVGTADYTGPLAIRDFIAQPGASLVDWAPLGGWFCGAGGGGGYYCNHPATVTLSPGESRELLLVVQGPPLVAGYTHVRNCAHFDWQDEDGDFNPGNEFDCATIYRYPPGHPGAVPILEVDKKALPTCVRPGGAGNPWFCIYNVLISNTGGVPYEDPIAFTDEAVPHPATLAFLSPTPDWSCAPGVGGAGTQTCTHAAIAGGLLPGETLTAELAFQLPAGTPVPSVERNCATIKWDSDGDGVEEEHEACADAIICDAGTASCPNDLALLKGAPAAPCDVGDPCAFDVTVQNISGAGFAGPLTLDELPETDLGPPAFTPAAGWSCTPAGGTYQCTNPAGIPPGGVANWQVAFDLPGDYPAPTFGNCAKVTVTPPDNVWPDNDEDCAIAEVPAPDLAPWSPSTCTRGKPCDLDVQIDNLGSRPFKGKMGLRGTLSPPVPIDSIASTTPGLTCRKTGNGAYRCDANNITVEPHGAATFQLHVTIPEDFPQDTITHTKEMVWPDRTVKDKKPENDKHVSTIDILSPVEPKKTEPTPEPPPPPPPEPEGKPDLALSKTAMRDRCDANRNCNFRLTVSNAGDAPYSGPVTLTDKMTPDGARFIGDSGKNWSCSDTGGGAICTDPNLTLAPGASNGLILSFAVPRYRSGSGRNCAELSTGGAVAQSGDRIRDVQSALAARGIDPGPIDGKLGRQTLEAVREYQKRAGLPANGRIDPVLLNSLFGPQDGGGAADNPSNNRDCATVALEGEAPPPPRPEPCSGGRDRNSHGQCVCPSHRPVWTGRTCVPQGCSGGRERRNGRCVCPSDRPVWNGKYCTQPGCTGGRVRSSHGQCVCPSNRPVWNGQVCIPRQPAPCTGGRARNNKGQCVCPLNKPMWTGQFCIPIPLPCSGGRTRNNHGQCVCPSHRPVWNGKSCMPKGPPPCSGGRVRSGHGQCVCPRSKPYWTGSKCTQYHTLPHPQPNPTPPPQHGCSGGRIRTGHGQCVCPSSKPNWNGRVCLPKLQINPGIKIPFQIPQIR